MFNLKKLNKYILVSFYMQVNIILNLKMYRMQFLDERHILIKYVSAENILGQKINNSISIAANIASASANAMSSSSGANNLVINMQPTANSNSIQVISNQQSVGNGNFQSNQTNSNNANTTAAVSSTTANLTNISSILTTHIANGATTTVSSLSIPVLLNENAAIFYFVLYDTKTAQILNILRNTSAQLLDAYENFQDYFSLSTLDGFNYSQDSDYSRLNRTNHGCPFNFHTLPSNNMYARQLLQRHMKNISKFNNFNEMAKCILSQLPISSQSYTTSPYLDHSLFSYDEKLISNLERPKPIGDHIIKFNNRETGRLCFRLYPGTQTSANYPSSHHASFKRLVAFIWHPREPFCISVQRGPHEYNVNFHVYTKNNLI
jgi:hypothetical protein